MYSNIEFILKNTMKLNLMVEHNFKYKIVGR